MALKHKKKNLTVELLLCIFLGYFGAHRFYAGKTKSALLYLFTMGLFGLGWLFDIVEITVRVIKEALAKRNLNPDAKRQISTVRGTAELTYHYDDVKFYPPEEILEGVDISKFRTGDEITLVQEPENEYDPRAVALYIKDQKIGYMLRNRLQDMANDYIALGQPVKASLTSLLRGRGEYHGYFSISFYRNHR